MMSIEPAAFQVTEFVEGDMLHVSDSHLLESITVLIRLLQIYMQEVQQRESTISAYLEVELIACELALSDLIRWCIEHLLTLPVASCTYIGMS